MKFLYLLKSYTKDNPILKLGYTSNIESRLNQYRSNNPGIEIIYVAQLNNAYKVEQLFHKNNVSIYGNEWYDISMLDTILNHIKSYPHVIYNKDNNFKYIVESCKLSDEIYRNWAYNKFPFLKESINNLGYNKIKYLNYDIAKIKIANEFSKLYNTKKGNSISIMTAKNILTTISKKLKIKVDVKLETYFHINKIKTKYYFN